MSLSQTCRICRNYPITLTLTAVFAVSAAAQERQINGNSLLAEVAKELRATTQMISAETEVKIQAFGQTIYGKGTYAQCPLKGEFLVCTTLQMELLAHRKAEYQLNRNENELIIQHDLNAGRDFVGRVSLRRLREAGVLKNGNLAAGGVPGAVPLPAIAPVDGIASTMEALSTHFQFGKVQTKKVDGIEYHATRGNWKLASLNAFGGGQGKLPDSMPDSVEIVIETVAGEGLTGFPHSITYLKRVTKGGVVSHSPMVSIRYQDVKILDPGRANLNTLRVTVDGGRKVVDITDQYLAPPPP